MVLASTVQGIFYPHWCLYNLLKLTQENYTFGLHSFLVTAEKKTRTSRFPQLQLFSGVNISILLTVVHIYPLQNDRGEFEFRTPQFLKRLFID